jgi:hypothetical protein
MACASRADFNLQGRQFPQIKRYFAKLSSGGRSYQSQRLYETVVGRTPSPHGIIPDFLRFRGMRKVAVSPMMNCPVDHIADVVSLSG